MVFAWLLLPLSIAVEWLVWGIRQGVEYVRPVNIRKRRRERPCAPPVALPHRRRQVRNAVYREILVCYAPLHIWRTHKRLWGRPCGAQSVRGISRVATHEQCQPQTARDGSDRRRSNGDAPRQDRVIPLFSSCRRILVLPPCPSMSQSDCSTDIPRSIPFISLLLCAFRGNSIDSDTRNSWPRLCAALTAMDSLDALSIAMGTHTRSIHNSEHTEFPVLPLLTPLKEVQARRFRVEVPPGCLLSDWLGEEDQRFSLEIWQELKDSCDCCSFVPRGSSFPFPPSWDDVF
ncbi:hypothetical protein BDW71DRAFT_200561 [Aspergillus fruticulosus]